MYNGFTEEEMSQEKKNIESEAKGYKESLPVSNGNKKPFIHPEIKEYPNLKNVTLLSLGGVSGSTFFKTFK